MSGFYYDRAQDGIILDSSFLTKNGLQVGPRGIIGGFGDTHPNGIYGYDYAWTIGNRGGVIAWDGSGTGDGVLLKAGGEVNNGIDGSRNSLIEGYVGVYIKNGSGTVTNYGAIRGFGSELGADDAGVELTAGGTVTNGGKYSTDAQISGYVSRRGVLIEGAAGTVTNYGRIVGYAAYVGIGYTAGAGVGLAAGGVVTNGATGTVTFGHEAEIDGPVGIDIEGGFGTVTNFGEVFGIQGYAGDGGIKLGAGGIVTNGSTIANSGGQVEGTYFGIDVAGAAGAIANYGRVLAGNSFGRGIYLHAGGSITNGASASTYADISGGRVGIEIRNGVGTVTNFGEIAGETGILVPATNTSAITVTNAGTIDGVGGTAVQFGAGNAVLIVDPAAVFTGKVNGGGGANTVIEGAPGALKVTGFTGFETIDLANGGTDSLTLTSANFTGVAGHVITVNDGNSGNTVSAATLPSSDAIIVHAGSGADTLIGGAGNDILHAGGKTTMTGGAGKNQFTFADIGTNGITDFAASATNEIVVRKSGFNLGADQGLATGTPQHLAASVFVANSTGAFTTTGQRFAYNTTTGALRYSHDGSGSASSAVVVLSGHPSLSAGASGQMFFTS